MNNQKQKGVSLLLTLLILSTVLVVACAVTTIMIGELKISREVYSSLRAYAAAEAGMERTLYDERQGDGASDIGSPPNCSSDTPGVACIDADNCYSVDFEKSDTSVTIKSYGCYKGARRAVEVSYSW